LFALLASSAAMLGGCGRGDDKDSAQGDTARMGSYGSGPKSGAASPGSRLSAADAASAARALPSPPAPPGTQVQMTMVDAKTGLALWEQDGRVMVSRYTNNTKWQTPHPLEGILGTASNARLASNGRGVAMAVWQHTLGEIESLRFSRWQPATGWSTPDVMPGALPQPRDSRFSARERAPVLEVDPQGNVRAEWRSGFNAEQVQASTFVPGEGWAHPVDLPAAAAQPQQPQEQSAQR
jgi:hypothetical protein